MSLDTRRYAQDLYNLAKEQNDVEKYFSELQKLNEAINFDVKLQDYIDSTNNSASEKKKKILSKVGVDNVILTAYFAMNNAIGKAHTELMLLHDFIEYYYQLKGYAYGVVYSVRPLSAKQIKDIEKAISNQLDNKVALENKLDESLIGGIKVTCNNNVWDDSYRNKLNELKYSLLAEDDELEASTGKMVTNLKNQINTFEKKKIDVQTSDTIGYVTSVADGIVNISGIYKAMAGEFLRIGKATAMVMNLNDENIGAVLLSNAFDVVEGDIVEATGSVVEVPVGNALLGRVINAIGEPIDGKGSIKASKKMPIEQDAPGVIERESVKEPLETGLMIIDSMIPIGKGQRELIIGDRQTGKTAMAIDTIINQQGKGVKCVYVAIGQKNSTVAQIVRKLEQTGALSYTTIIVAGAADLPALQYIAPYSGCSIGEYWMRNGEDVLIVYDDLSKHAVSYRTLSLLLRRPPGREAYPGDVFYLHSRLLERSAKLSKELGGGSLTALPIIETLAGDISAYIPTNVISITDGQIFLQTELFNSGVRPAVDSGLSVSRVGSAAQTKAMKKVSSSLKLDLAQYHEVLSFSQFGSDLDSTTKKVINHGKHLTELLIQPQYKPMSQVDQVILLFANQKGFLDQIPVELIKRYQESIILDMHSAHPDIIEFLENENIVDDNIAKAMYDALDNATKRFIQLV